MPPWHTSLPRGNKGTDNISMVNELVSWEGVLNSRMLSTGPPTDMVWKYTLHYLRLIVTRTCFATHVAFARQLAYTWRLQYISALEEWARGNTSRNAPQAVAATFVSRYLNANAVVKLIFNAVNIEKFYDRTYIPSVYYPRRSSRRRAPSHAYYPTWS